MANEFVARNGVIAQNNSTVSGSLTVTNGIVGSLTGTSSYANNADTIDGLDSTVFATTASLNATTTSFTAFSASINSFSASVLTYTSSANTRFGNIEAATASLFNFSSSHNSATSSLFSYTSSNDAKIASIYSTTQSLNSAVSSLNTATGSLNNATSSLQTYTSSNDAKISSLYGATSSLFNFSSSVNNATSSLYSFTSSMNAKTSSFATTGSNTFIGTQTITGSLNISGSINSSGTITAQTLVVQVVTSSQNFITGSTKFGSVTVNTHQFTGSVSASGSLNINSGILYADGANVGIGSSTPAYKLDVQGTGYFSGQVTMANQLFFNSSATNIYTYGRIGNTNAGRIIYNNGTGANMFFGELAASVYGVTLDAYTDRPAIAFDLANTRVGIGTNAPLNQLTVYDSTEPRIQLTSLSNYYSGSWIGRDSSGLYIIERQNGAIRFNTSGEAMRITGSFVGINNTNPKTTLHVVGYAWINRPSNKVDNNSATEFGSRVEFNNAFGSGASGYTVFHYPSSNVFRIYGDYDGNIGGTQPDIQLGVGYLTVKSSNGNVGINTTSPGYKFDVRSSNTDSEVLANFQNAHDALNEYGIIAIGQASYKAYFGQMLQTYDVAYMGMSSNPSTGNGIYYSTANRVGINKIQPTVELEVAGAISASGNLYINGNVGIGTTSPKNLLHIYSGSAGSYSLDSRYKSVLESSGEIYQYYIVPATSYTGMRFGNPSVAVKGAVEYWMSEDKMHLWSTGSYQLYTGGALAMFVSSSGTVYVNASGDSNITDASTAVKLVVNGDQHFTRQGAKIYFGDVGSGTPLSIGEGDQSESGQDKDNMYIYHRNKLVIQGGVSGSYATYVGIGTATPTYTLDVNGDFRVTSNTVFTNGNVGIGTTSATSQFHIYNNNTYSAANINEATGSQMAFKIRTRAGNAVNIIMGAFDSTQAGLQVVDTGSGAANGFLINPYGGNVGVGTTGAPYRFTIYGTGASNGVTLNINDAASVADSRHILFTRSSATASIGIAGSQANDPLWFSRSGGYNLTILPDGNVGIGTPAPTQNLHVAGGSVLIGGTGTPGTLQLGDYSSSQNAKFIFSAGGQNNLDIVTNYASSANVINIKPANTLALSLYGDSRAYFAGNVGIGTTSPADKLEIYNGTYHKIKSFFEGSYTSGFKFSDYNGGIKYDAGNDRLTLFANYTAGVNAAEITFETSGSEKMRIDANGNVGIGTSTPGVLLQVSPGSSYAGNPTIQIVSSYADGYDAMLSLNNTHTGGRNWSIRSTNNSRGFLGGGKLVFQDTTAGSDTAIMTLVTGGSVGIGSTSPTQKLDVNGYIISSGSISVQNPAKSSASTFTSPQEIMDAGWAEGNGLYYINPGGQLGASVQVYCDFTTRDYKGETGWMLVASWATDYTWPTNTATTTGVLDSTAADRWSANFGNFEVQDLRVHAGSTVDSGGPNSSDDWYYHRDSPLTWKKWWASASGNTGLYPAGTGGNPSIRAGIIGFDWSHNLKFNYINTAHKSNGMSDAAGSIDFWTALTTSGQSININGIAGDGSFAWSPTLANTGQDVGGQQGMVGYDDTSPVAYYGTAYNSSGGAQGAGTGNSTKLWLWVKGVSKSNLWTSNPGSTNIYASNTSANVGIGTTSPASTLQVDASGGGLIRATRTGAGSGYIQMEADGTNGTLAANNTLYFNAGGGTKMTILSGGNIGIGTSNPQQTLDVRGNIYAVATTPKIMLSPGSYGGSYNTVLGSRSNAEGVLQFGNNGSNYIAAGNSLTGGALYFYTNCSSDFVAGNNGTAAMLLDASGNTIIYNNVGIGTTSPGAKLHISTPSTQPFLIYGDSGDTNGLFRIQMDSVSDSFGTGARTFLGDGGIDIFIGTGNSSYTPANTYMALNHSGEIYMGAGSATKHFTLSTGGTLTISGDVVAYSDARVKKDVSPITGALEKIMKIQGVSYIRTDIENDKSTKIGFIAQDIKEILPEVVNYDEKNDRYSVAYGNVTALLVEAIKELKAEIDILKQK